MIMVQEPGDTAPDAVEYRHGLTPPMEDARKQRFRREPDLNPELVQRVEENLLTLSQLAVLPKQSELNRLNKRKTDANKKPAPEPVAKPDDTEPIANAGEPERSDSDESDETSS